MPDNLRINGDRLWESLMEMAKIGATEKGGNCRLALSDLDLQGRALFIKWCEQAGCSVKIDKMGNIFARREGRNPDLPPVLTGSHLDTQPTGGRFDGVYGVLAGLEVIRTLNDLDIETEAAVEVCVWTNEEGSRFAPAMMGSGVYAGVFDYEDTLAIKDPDGISVGDALNSIGHCGDTPIGGRDIGAYFEAHIEQGPVLENADKVIGVVTKGQGIRWYDVTISGQESHAGTTPMPLRRDALISASKLAQRFNQLALDNAPGGLSTIGCMEVYPNSRNTIPGTVTMTLDLRYPEEPTLLEMDAKLQDICQQIQIEDGVEINLSLYWYSPPTDFDETCVGEIRKAANKLGHTNMDIYSGAGHDAIYLARVAPTAMIFIPCKDGISHNEIESAEPDHCAAGCDVLLGAILGKASS